MQDTTLTRTETTFSNQAQRMTCGGAPQSIQGTTARQKNIAYPQPQILSMTFPCGCLNTTPCDMKIATAGRGKKMAWVSLCGMTALIAATASPAQ